MRSLDKDLRAKQSGIEACPLFARLPAADKRSLAEASAWRVYARGEMLFLQGDRADGFYAVITGSVKVCRLGREGREQVLHLLGAGELCGEVPVFQGGRYPATAVADAKTEAIYVPGDRFLDLGQKHPQILLEMLAVLSQRLRTFVGLIDDLALNEISARLAKHLLDLGARAQAPAVELATAKGVLAARLGTVAETLSRTLARMQKRRIIEVRGRKIRILDREALAALAAGAKL